MQPFYKKYSCQFLADHKQAFVLVFPWTCQCSLQVPLVSLHWASCDLSPNSKVCRSHQSEWKSCRPMERFSPYWRSHNKILASLGTSQHSTVLKNREKKRELSLLWWVSIQRQVPKTMRTLACPTNVIFWRFSVKLRKGWGECKVRVKCEGRSSKTIYYFHFMINH